MERTWMDYVRDAAAKVGANVSELKEFNATLDVATPEDGFQIVQLVEEEMKAENYRPDLYMNNSQDGFQLYLWLN